MFFRFFFGRRGREEWVERQEELAEFEWGPDFLQNGVQEILISNQIG